MVFGLGKDILFASILGRCEQYVYKVIKKCWKALNYRQVASDCSLSTNGQNSHIFSLSDKFQSKCKRLFERNTWLNTYSVVIKIFLAFDTERIYLPTNYLSKKRYQIASITSKKSRSKFAVISLRTTW